MSHNFNHQALYGSIGSGLQCLALHQTAIAGIVSVNAGLATEVSVFDLLKAASVRPILILFVNLSLKVPAGLQ